MADNHIYLLTDSQLSWTQAEEQAVSLGGHLVTINNSQENQFLVDTFGIGTPYWIGLNDIETEGQFEWISGEKVTYTNWDVSKPYYTGIKDYVDINSGSPGKWNVRYNNPGQRWSGIGIIEVSDVDQENVYEDQEIYFSGKKLEISLGDGNILYGDKNKNKITLLLSYSNNVYAGNGNDTIDGGDIGYSSSYFYGGAGNDKILLGSLDGINQVYGEDGNDQIIIDYLIDDDSTDSIINGGSGHDKIFIGDIDYFVSYIIDGNEGNDKISIGDMSSIYWIEGTVYGGNGNDKISIDYIYTAMAYNIVDGEEGNDTISIGQMYVRFGDEEDDDVGNRTYGGNGNDKISIDEMYSTQGGYSIVNGENGNDKIFIGEIYVDFDDYDSTGKSIVNGEEGNDKISINAINFDGGGESIVNGGNGNDKISINAINFDDGFDDGGESIVKSIVNGGNGNDGINLKYSAQTIISGGLGRDLISIKDSEGTTYVYDDILESQPGGKRDKINGFNVSFDKIDISTIDANVELTGHQSFTFIEENQFYGDSGQIRYDPKKSIIQLELGGDSDLVPDMEIYIKGLTYLTEANFTNIL